MQRPTSLTFLLLPAGLLATILAVSSLAAPGKPSGHTIEFPISIEEATTRSAERREQRFNTADTNGDKLMTVEEFAVVLEKLSKKDQSGSK